MKYSLSTREIPRAEPNGFSEKLSISKNYTPSIVLPETLSFPRHSQFLKIILKVLSFQVGRAILEELILRIGLAAGAKFSHSAQ